jgi:hypothetical protein
MTRDRIDRRRRDDGRQCRDAARTVPLPAALPDDGPPPLAPRERLEHWKSLLETDLHACLDLAEQGHDKHQIARSLGVSVRSVERKLQRIRTRLLDRGEAPGP